MYLKRDGTQVENLPALSDYAEDDPDMGGGGVHRRTL